MLFYETQNLIIIRRPETHTGLDYSRNQIQTSDNYMPLVSFFVSLILFEYYIVSCIGYFCSIRAMVSEALSIPE